jgi:hypothetical protein
MLPGRENDNLSPSIAEVKMNVTITPFTHMSSEANLNLLSIKIHKHALYLKARISSFHSKAGYPD